MTDYERTTRWGYATRRTDVATNTTLGTATRFEFGAKTITAETSRTVRSAFLVIKAVDSETTTAVDWDGIRIGVNVQAAGFVDVDTTLTGVNTGENECMEWIHDCTANVVTNSGVGATFTVDVAIAVAHGVASNIRSITAELFLTYSASDGASAHMKTIQIPMHAYARFVTNAFTEVGVADGAAGSATANQIPQLTGAGDPFLPESSITIKDHYMICTGTTAPAATTDDRIDWRLDGATTITGATKENGLQTSTPVSEHLASAEMASTSAAHAFEALGSINNSNRWIGGVMVVTYEYDPASTTHLVSVCTPFVFERRFNFDGATETVPVLQTARLHIQEPGPIIPKQSGALYHAEQSTSSMVWTAAYGGQTGRPYDGDTGYVFTSTTETTHRFDVAQSTFDLARGWNELGFSWLPSIYVTTADLGSGYAIVNYHAGKAAGGCRAHNRTTWWFMRTYRGTAATSSELFTPTPPTITGDYKLSAVGVSAAVRCTGVLAELRVASGVDDDTGPGQQRLLGLANSSVFVEIGSKRSIYAGNDIWRVESAVVESQAYGTDLEVAHQYASLTNVVTSSCFCMFATYHQISRTLTGTYTVDGANQTSTDLDIYAVDEIEDTSLRVGTVTTNGSGVFTKEVFDDTLLYAVHDPALGHGSVRGYVAANIDTPSIRSVGTATAVASGASTPTIGKHRKYDVSYLVIVGINGETLSLSTANGFTQIADSPQDATGAKIAVFEKLHTTKNDASPVITATTDFHAARIITIRGAHRTTPIDVTNGATAATSTAVSMPDDTTTVDNTLVLNFLGVGFDSATLQASAWANANLKFFSEVMAAQTALGGGGGYSVAAGSLIADGAIGASTATLANTSTQGKITVALKPHVPTAEANFNIAAFSTGGGGGGAYRSKGQAVAGLP